MDRHGCDVIKNAKIPNDCVVGACSVVAKAFDDSNVVIAGNPAKVIREDVLWQG
jgi:serine acetyltransferase